MIFEFFEPNFDFSYGPRKVLKESEQDVASKINQSHYHQTVTDCVSHIEIGHKISKREQVVDENKDEELVEYLHPILADVGHGLG